MFRQDVAALCAEHAQLYLFRARHRTGPFAPGDEERAFGS